MLLRRLYGRPVNRNALRRRQAGVLWWRAKIGLLGLALRGGRVFIAEEPVINHPENSGEKEGPWQNQRQGVLDHKAETEDGQEHRQAEEDHPGPTANASLALGRLDASKRACMRDVQMVRGNAVAREQVGHAVQTKAAARTKSHAIGSWLITASRTIHMNLTLTTTEKRLLDRQHRGLE